MCAQNRERNGQCSNVEWRAADATTLQLEAESADVVFSNWLLMYLADDEVAKLAADSLSWVGSCSQPNPLGQPCTTPCRCLQPAIDAQRCSGRPVLSGYFESSLACRHCRKNTAGTFMLHPC